MTRPVPVHYLRPNEREWTPAAIIVLDTETRTLARDGREVLALRLWAASYDDRRTRGNAAARSLTARGLTAQELAQQINGWLTGRESVWLFAHNLAFDLVVSRLHRELRRHGWTIRDSSIGGRSPWLIMGKGRKTITATDSSSYLPLPLEEIGVRLQMPKLALPAEDDTEAAWYARCERDVAITRAAILQLMAWWDEHKLGNWTLTGPATGWNAHRHVGGDFPVVMDPDPEKVAQERPGVHGGRRGVWSLGHHEAGPYAELDFTAAYPTIAAHRPLPAKRAYPFDSLPLDDVAMTPDRWGVLAWCRLDTATPRWPVRLANTTWYPVGEFWAFLAQPDIDEAARLGALREIGPGWAHKLRPHLATWARWCLAVQSDPTDATPPMARLAAKHWGRTVIGRYASRGWRKIELGAAVYPDWHYEPGWDAGSNAPAGLLDQEGKRWWVVGDGTPDNCYPAVTAWVEAEVRVRLGRAIDALGAGCLVQCDTDGMIVNTRLVGTRAAGGHLRAPQGMSAAARLTWCLDQIEPVCSPLMLRVKRVHDHVDIAGPQHLSTPAQRKLAGMPRDAVETGPRTYQGYVWPGLKWQLEHGDPAGYVRPHRTFRVAAQYPTGWVTSARRVEPVTMTVGPDRTNRIVPWRDTALGRQGVALADEQHAALDELR